MAAEPKNPLDDFKPYTKEDLDSPEAILKCQGILLDLQKKIMEYGTAIKDAVKSTVKGELTLWQLIKNERDPILQANKKKPAFAQAKELAKTTWYKSLLGSYKAALDKRKTAVVQRRVELDEEKKRRDSGKITAWISWGCGWIGYLAMGLAIVGFLGPFIAINMVREEISQGKWVNVDLVDEADAQDITLEEITTDEFDAGSDFDDFEMERETVDWDEIRQEVEKRRMEAYEEMKKNGTLDEYEFEVNEDAWNFDDDDDDDESEPKEPLQEQKKPDSDDEEFSEIEVDRSFYDDDTPKGEPYKRDPELAKKMEETQAEIDRLEKQVAMQKAMEFAAEAKRNQEEHER